MHNVLFTIHCCAHVHTSAYHYHSHFVNGSHPISFNEIYFFKPYFCTLLCQLYCRCGNRSTQFHLQASFTQTIISNSRLIQCTRDYTYTIMFLGLLKVMFITDLFIVWTKFVCFSQTINHYFKKYDIM